MFACNSGSQGGREEEEEVVAITSSSSWPLWPANVALDLCAAYFMQTLFCKCCLLGGGREPSQEEVVVVSHQQLLPGGHLPM